MTLPSHLSMDDLYGAGLVGLLNAVRRFDPKGGSSFEAYTRVRIRGAIFDELRRLDWVPRSVHDKAKKVEQTMHTLVQRKGGIPTDVEMAKALDLSLREYDERIKRIKTFRCTHCGENGVKCKCSTNAVEVAAYLREGTTNGN